MKTNVRLISFFLPQFHRIPENDEWWGDGYTEWVKVKNGQKYFDWQNQPKVPLNDNYYNLLNKDILVEQGKLALNYGIDGFCYYHYWFKGRKLLEKPIEMMLENKEVTIPYCLSWANHKWTRIWDGNSDELLVEMEYGDKDDWVGHIRYLINFFLDERYIKIDNRPVFLIYQTNDYQYFDNMITIWNIELNKVGLNEIYLIETFNFFQKKSHSEKSEGAVLFEPMFTLAHQNNFIDRIILFVKRKLKPKNKPIVYDFQYIWKKILNSNFSHDTKKIFYCAFANWDNTARKKDRGIVVKNSSIFNFESNIKALLIKSQKNKLPFLFINAWNEWSEGAYLEPDNKNGFSYLEAIKKAKHDFKQKLY
jgi:lipopolysaccharide biosynthesis protein